MGGPVDVRGCPHPVGLTSRAGVRPRLQLAGMTGVGGQPTPPPCEERAELYNADLLAVRTSRLTGMPSRRHRFTVLIER